MGWILLGAACAEPEKFYRHELADAGSGGRSGAAGVFGTAGTGTPPLPTTGAAGTGTISGNAGAAGTTVISTGGAGGSSSTGAAGSFATGAAGTSGASGASGVAGKGAAGATGGTGGPPFTDAGSDASLPPPTVSDAGGSCAGVAVYTSGNTYQADDRVVNAGSLYQCRPWPNSGWCSMAAAYYGPGIGSAWMDAWTLVGRCN